MLIKVLILPTFLALYSEVFYYTKYSCGTKGISDEVLGVVRHLIGAQGCVPPFLEIFKTLLDKAIELSESVFNLEVVPLLSRALGWLTSTKPF